LPTYLLFYQRPDQLSVLLDTEERAPYTAFS
jgi:hypothetical protein